MVWFITPNPQRGILFGKLLFRLKGFQIMISTFWVVRRERVGEDTNTGEK